MTNTTTVCVEKARLQFSSNLTNHRVSEVSDLKDRGGFSFCELRNVAGVGFTGPEVLGVIIQLCERTRPLQVLTLSLALKPDGGRSL